MKIGIAYCGLVCDTCPVHVATLETDPNRKQVLRESVAAECCRLYGMLLNPEEIADCDGCRSDTGRLFSGCRNCVIRRCAIMKNLESCAFCRNYACEILEKHFLTDPGARIRLETLRKN